MTRSRFSPLRIAVVAALATFALAVAPAASAHTSLIDTSPASGDVVTELTDLRLEFSDELLNVGSSARIAAADGTATELVIDLSVPRVLSAPLPTDLSPGEYMIAWRVVAADGHPLEGSIDFTYKPEGGALTVAPSPSETAAAAPTVAPSPSETAAAAPTTSASLVPSGIPIDGAGTNDGTDTNGESVWWWIIVIGLVAGTGIGFIMFRVGRTSAVNGGDAKGPASQ